MFSLPIDMGRPLQRCGARRAELPRLLPLPRRLLSPRHPVARSARARAEPARRRARPTRPRCRSSGTTARASSCSAPPTPTSTTESPRSAPSTRTCCPSPASVRPQRSPPASAMRSSPTGVSSAAASTPGWRRPRAVRAVPAAGPNHERSHDERKRWSGRPPPAGLSPAALSPAGALGVGLTFTTAPRRAASAHAPAPHRRRWPPRAACR